MKKQNAIRIGKFTKQTLREVDYLNMEITYANIEKVALLRYNSYAISSALLKFTMQ